MTLSIFHGIGMLLLGIAIAGMIDHCLIRALGVALAIAGCWVTWGHRSQFRRDDAR